MKCETSQICHDFLTSLQSCYLIPTVDKPTRAHRNSATLIDNIFVKNPDQILLSGNIISDISDHFSQFCIIKAARDKYRGHTTKIRHFSKFSADQFNKELSEADLDSILINHATDPDKSFSTFYNKFNNIVNKHAPITKLTKRKAKQFSKPWITTGLKASIKVKNKLYVSGDEDKYKYYRNKICSLIRLSKKIYYQDYFERHKTNMKKTWEGINDVLHRRMKTKLITSLEDPNNCNKIVKEPSQIPNILNEHFASVGNRLASKLPTPQQHYLNYVSHCKSPTSSFLFQPVTSDEVKFQILSIPNNKSYGLYSSPIKLLKYASSIIFSQKF